MLVVLVVVVVGSVVGIINKQKFNAKDEHDEYPPSSTTGGPLGRGGYPSMRTGWGLSIDGGWYTSTREACTSILLLVD